MTQRSLKNVLEWLSEQVKNLVGKDQFDWYKGEEIKLPRQALSLMWDTVRLITCCAIQGDNCYQMLTVL